MPHTHVLVCAQSCLTLCDPMDWSSPGSSVHEVTLARILTFPSPGDLPDPRIKPEFLASPALAGEFLSLSHLGNPTYT